MATASIVLRPKLIYFARRHPSLSAADFPSRWREHGRLGMSLARWRNVRRYAQCDVLEVPGLIAAYDGVATVVFHSEAARLAHLADPSASVTRADEPATFAAPVGRSAVLTHEVVLARGAGSATKLFVGLRRRSGLTREAFLAGRASRRPARLRRILAVDPGAGLIENEAIDASNEIEIDCVDEIETDVPGLVAEAVAEALAEEADLAARESILLATREILMSECA